MSIKGRLTGHFLGRAFLLFLALGFVFTAWTSVLAVWVFLINDPGDVASTSPIQTLEFIEANTRVDGDEVAVSDAALARVEEENVWLQVLDSNGEQIFEHRRPADVPDHYTPGELVAFRQNPGRIGQEVLFTWYSGESSLTWVLGGDDQWATALQRALLGPDDMLPAVIVLVAASLGVAVLVAWVSSETLARPLVHMMTWLEGLGRGDYAEPRDRLGRVPSRDEDGKLRRPYRTYREVIDALDSLTAQLARADAERARMESAREEWITGISHDVRTPLTSVQGYADLLSSAYDFDEDEVREYARIIAEKSAHIERLVQDLGLTYRLRSDGVPLELRRADLVGLARDAAVDLANDPRSDGRQILFEDDASADEVIVEIDVAWFARALSNLLVNAVVHNPVGTRVSVSVSRDGNEACVRIADDGRGMDEATISRLFDRYYRGVASDSDASGTGLGMAIARQLVEAHNGSISVVSEPEAGTTFVVCVRAALDEPPS